MNNTVKKHTDKILRGIDEIIGLEDIQKKIKNGKQLRIKFGADPTSPDLHLGHSVVMEKLRTFQELGHKVIFIIGDFTARIGDPSGRTVERPVLSQKEIGHSIKSYEKQIFKILKKENIELVRNSKWLEKLGADGIIRLARHYTVARMLERNDFEQRYKNGSPITISEFLYPLLQGYDSVEVEADVELGGTDQKFNLLMGRELQRDMGQTPQAIIMMPLLEGTDGIKKMSKTYGNHIGIEDPPHDMFGKIMSVSDELMLKYYDLLTDENPDKIRAMHPMEAKKRLASGIIEKYYSKEDGVAARIEFEKIFSRGDIPSNIDIYKLKSDEKLIEIIFKTNLVIIARETKRLIKQGAVTIDGKKIINIDYFPPNRAAVIKIGKRGFLKIEPE